MRRPTSLALLLLAVLIVSCSDDSGGGTTVTINDGSVIIGEGEIPDTIPEDFPIPEGVTIGSTLVDKINNRSEVNMIIMLNNQQVIRYFEVGLVNQGYVVTSSTGSGNAWTIEYSRGELAGNVLITPQGDFSQISVSVNQA